MTLRALLTLLLLLAVMPAHAQDTSSSTSSSNKGESNRGESSIGANSAEPTLEELESSGEVVIRGSESGLINEFRINGQLYMIRITPKKGLPYYLVDSDGDGNLETRWNDLAPELLIPAWVLLRW